MKNNDVFLHHLWVQIVIFEADIRNMTKCNPCKPSNPLNLVLHKVRYFKYQIDFFKELKSKGGNVSHFIRVAVDRAIEAETTKHL